MRWMRTMRYTRLAFLVLPSVAVLSSVALGCSRPERPAGDERMREARAQVSVHGATENTPAATQTGQHDQGLSDAQRAIVVAKIGDFKITLGDVEHQIAALPPFARARYRSFEKKVEFLNNLVQFELLAMEAHAKGYDTHPDVVLAMKRAMIQKFTQNDLQKLVTVSKITAADVARYYDNNSSMFNKSEQIRAAHILFESEADATKALSEIRAAVAADPPRTRVIFSDFVRRLSKDNDTSTQNGDLGFFAADGYVKGGTGKNFRVSAPLVKAAFALKKVNDISSVVKSEAGWHLVQLTNRRPAVHRSVADAKRQITNILLREKKDEAREAYISGLRKKANVTVFEDQLKLIEVDWLSSHGTNHAAPAPGAMLPIPKGVQNAPSAAENAAAAKAAASTGTAEKAKAAQRALPADRRLRMVPAGKVGGAIALPAGAAQRRPQPPADAKTDRRRNP